MSESNHPRISVIDAAAILFAGYHFFLACEFLIGIAIVWRERGFDFGALPNALSLASLALILLFTFGLSIDLLRRREWARVWFSRFVSMEFGIITGVVALGPDPDPNFPPSVRPLLIVCGAVSSVAWVAKIWLRRRMARPPLRSQFH